MNSLSVTIYKKVKLRYAALFFSAVNWGGSLTFKSVDEISYDMTTEVKTIEQHFHVISQFTKFRIFFFPFLVLTWPVSKMKGFKNVNRFQCICKVRMFRISHKQGITRKPWNDNNSEPFKGDNRARVALKNWRKLWIVVKVIDDVADMWNQSAHWLGRRHLVM